MIVALLVLSFVLGSIPTGLLIAKSKGVDLRKVGSGNIGATNVMRALGKEAALLTLLGDMLKGAFPLLVYRIIPGTPYLIQGQLSMVSPELFMGMLGIVAILGHNFSVFLKFKGGKGVATSLGMLLAYSPHVALFTVVIWLITAKWTRYSSLSALVAFGLLPLSFYVIDYSKEKLLVAVVISLLIFIRHAGNIKRLVQGTESRIGQKG